MEQVPQLNQLCLITAMMLRSHRVDLKRMEALSKLARLALGSQLEDPNESLIMRVKTMEAEEKHESLLEEFFKDNISKKLPPVWRRYLLSTVLARGDLLHGTFLAIANALYRPRDPCEMMLEIPSPVRQFLRSIAFESGHEVDAYLCSSAFEDIMRMISEARAKMSSEQDKEKVVTFVSKFCMTIAHVLCYEAAWTAGLLTPTPKDWGKVWDNYNFILAHESPAPEDNDHQLFLTENQAMAQISERMDAGEIASYLNFEKDHLEPLARALLMLTFGVKACERGQYDSASSFLQVAADYIEQEHQTTTAAYLCIAFQHKKYTAISRIGILAQEHEQRREKRILARLEQKAYGYMYTSTGTTVGVEQSNYNDDTRIQIDGEINPSPGQDVIMEPKEEVVNEEVKAAEICDHLNNYLIEFGNLESGLQGTHRAIMMMGGGLRVDFKDTLSTSCLDALTSSDVGQLKLTKMAALDLIQGLLITADVMAGSLEADFSPILKLFKRVRLQGVVDVFAALVAGAISLVLGENERLTLSEFGYYALFTTSMPASVASWTDPRVKIIVIVDGGPLGNTTNVSPLAGSRLSRLLIDLLEQQIQIHTESVTTRIKVEARARAQRDQDPVSWVNASEAGAGVGAGVGEGEGAGEGTGTGTGTGTGSLFSSKAYAHIARHSLCLTDLYHLEGQYQDVLASFLNACMVTSKCFVDLDRMNRRTWTTYTHDSAASLSPITSQQTVIVPSQPGGMIVPSGDVPSLSSFPVLSPVPTMTLGGFGGINGVNGEGHSPPAGAVSLGMNPQSPEYNGNSDSSSINNFGLSGIQGLGPTGGPPQPIPQSLFPQQSVSSSFVLRAIDSCLHLNEPLASAALQQFLFKMDYNQVFAAIRRAHEQGMLAFSPAISPVTPTPLPLPILSNNAPQSTVKASGGHDNVIAATLMPRVQSAEFVFTPGMKGIDRAAAARRIKTTAGKSSISNQMFLDSVFDVTMLELVCGLYKQSKDEQGLMRIQTRIQSNRMALDARQTFKEQVRALAQYDLLTCLWSKYARVG
ncbi:hypothetical protein BG011_009013 [Mortierella polycephala]|uniref:Uncharacterized protein n=1 Tax=Mortierella polycephala TaxID=41804 RepID=A0A9P6QD38_9FUNG|nr:hypothetical protein BG011_009013 [Mortierella polycephala]